MISNITRTTTAARRIRTLKISKQVFSQRQIVNTSIQRVMCNRFSHLRRQIELLFFQDMTPVKNAMMRSFSSRPQIQLAILSKDKHDGSTRIIRRICHKDINRVSRESTTLFKTNVLSLAPSCNNTNRFTDSNASLQSLRTSTRACRVCCALQFFGLRLHVPSKTIRHFQDPLSPIYHHRFIIHSNHSNQTFQNHLYSETNLHALTTTMPKARSKTLCQGRTG